MATLPHRLSDRVERIGRRACVTVAILGLLIAVALAVASYHATDANTDRYSATVHRTSATTLEDAPAAMPVSTTVQPRVAAKWAGIDHVVHRGRVEVPRGTEAGTEVTIWTDAAGKVSNAPQSSNQLVADAVLLAIALAIGATGVAYAVHLLLRVALARMRSREWELAWEDFDRQQPLH
jgi:hypothetical protein